MTTRAQVKAQWIALIASATDERLDQLAASREFHIAASEKRLEQYAHCPPIVKAETSDLAAEKALLRHIRAEQKARKTTKVAA